MIDGFACASVMFAPAYIRKYLYSLSPFLHTHTQKSRRFSIFSRGPLFGPLLDSVTLDHGITSASSGGGPTASGSTTTSGSRLISAPSDFQHLAHQGPDVRIHFIDLAQSQRTTRCSTGNFSLAVEPSVGAKQSGMHSDSQASLNSSSSRQSNDQVQFVFPSFSFYDREDDSLSLLKCGNDRNMV